MTWADGRARLNDGVLAEFSEDSSYQGSAGAAVAVSGIFDRAYVHVESGQAGVISTGPAIWYRLADLPSDPVTEPDGYPLVTVDGDTFEAFDVRKDGQGGVLLRLHQV